MNKLILSGVVLFVLGAFSVSGSAAEDTKLISEQDAGLKTMVSDAWESSLGRKGRVHSERFDFRGAYGLTELIYISGCGT